MGQHFFALRLADTSDVKAVLQALQRASVATDPKNSQLMKLSSDGPSELSSLARQLGKVASSASVYTTKLSVASVNLVAKPYALAVPPWQLVSATLDAPLRAATWWVTPKILSTR